MRASIHHTYFRLLETTDEAFPYSPDPIPPSGRWPIYGLDLPNHVLVQIYRNNARRLLGLDRDRREPCLWTRSGFPSDPAQVTNR